MADFSQPRLRDRRAAVTCLLAVLASTLALSSTARLAALDRGVEQSSPSELLAELDKRQNTLGDYRAEVYIESTEQGTLTTAYTALVFRRDEKGQFLLLFTKPKTSQGQGYLRVENHLWFYDPSVGRWERRTDRDRIGQTDSRRSDYDTSRLASEYDAEDNGVQELGPNRARVLTLRSKQGAAATYPIVKLWVHSSTGNILKRQDFSATAKLLRTTLLPKWRKAANAVTKAEVWFPAELRIYDELEKDSTTTIVIRSVDLSSLSPNLFTKAWLESKSR